VVLTPEDWRPSWHEFCSSSRSASRASFSRLFPPWFGFTSDNVKVRARFSTTFTNHGMQVPELLFLKLANEIHLETDLTFVRQ
jgi:hypothetical protein